MGTSAPVVREYDIPIVEPSKPQRALPAPNGVPMEPIRRRKPATVPVMPRRTPQRKVAS